MYTIRIFRFAVPHTLPQTLLVSFPGSGNTWLRFITETLTGAFTGSMYKDIMLANKGKYY